MMVSTIHYRFPMIYRVSTRGIPPKYTSSQWLVAAGPSSNLMIWVVRRRPDKVSRFILASEVERLRGPWSKVSLSVIQMSKGKWEYFRKVLDVCPKWLRETQLHSKTARAWAISDFLDKPMSGSTNAKINLWFQNALYLDPQDVWAKPHLEPWRPIF